MTLRAVFVRIRGQADRVYVHRSNGSEVSWTFPSYGDVLPHDLVHLVVESAFGLERGFWGRVEAGIDPSRVNAEANRIGGKDKYAGFGSDHAELLVAEGYANAPWLDDEVDDAACAALLGASTDQVRAVRARLAELQARWAAFGAKGSLELTFSP